MSKFDPQLMLVARTRIHLSQTQLARAIGRSQPYISKLEAGLVLPDDHTLERLSDALQVPRSYFESNTTIYPQTLEFHRTRRTTQAELGRLWAEMNMIRLMLVRLLASVEVEVERELPRLDLDEVETPEQAARLTRVALGLAPGPIRQLVEAAERAGVFVCGYDFHTNIVDGVSHLASGGLPPIVFLNTRAPADRMRWSLAHELGHLVLHRYPTPTMEEEANSFAAELLMPSADIKQVLRRRLDFGVVGMLKKIWGCSMQSIYRRARDLGTLTPRQYQRAIIAMGPMRKVEPHELEREPIDAVHELWRVHINDLGYSPSELATILPVSDDIIALTTGFRPLQIVSGGLDTGR